MFFRFLVFSFLLFSFSSHGFLENAECVTDIKEYAPKLFVGQLSSSQQERFFTCLHDALELVQDLTVPSSEENRDYYIEDDFFKLFNILLKQPKEESRSIARRIFAMKKIALGGHPDRYTSKEVDQTVKLMFDFEKFFYLIHKEIPYYRQIFLKAERTQLDSKRLDRSLRQLSRGFDVLRDAYKREKVSYDLSSLNQYHTYMNKAGVPNAEQDLETWKEFSKFLNIWADGVFSSSNKVVIEGRKWDYFFPAFHDLFSQFAYYKMYLSGKDVFSAETLPLTLKSLNFFISSLEYVKHNPSKPGFPLGNLDHLLQIMISHIGDSNAYASPTLHFLKKQKGLPISLLSRSLVCFSLKSDSDNSNSKSCTSSWNKKSSSQEVVKFSFPDGNFNVYEDRQEWTFHNQKEFYLEDEQIKALKTWLFYWSKGVARVASGELRSVAKRKNISHWLNDEFGQSSDGRFEFGRDSIDSHSLLPRMYTLLHYDALVRLVLNSYFDSSQSQISKANWVKFINEMSPALIALSSEGYKKNWRAKFTDLFEYGDLFLNSSNQNGLLSRSEVLDIMVHLFSAQKSSERAFHVLEKFCKGKKATCVDRHFIQHEGILDNFYGLRSDISNSNLENYTQMLKKLLPEQITSPYDFMNFFVLIQLVETNFGRYDQNKSQVLEGGEFVNFSQSFADVLVSKVPYLSNKRQAKAFLAYSAQKGVVPFLTESEFQMSSPEFINWYLYPSRWKKMNFSREKMVSMSVLFYELYNSLGSQ